MTCSAASIISLIFLVSCVIESRGFSTTFISNRSGQGRYSRQHSVLQEASIASGDRILVVGGTGGVGQLVTKKLRARGSYNVRVAARNKVKAQETLEDDQVEVAELDLVTESDDVNLGAALKGTNAVVISVGTTAFPTIKWVGGNNPNAVDNEAVTRIVKAATKVDGMKKIVLLTSVGVQRTNVMPFFMLNLFGVLDAKRSGEEALMEASKEGNFDYVIVRPGRLVGGPYTNLDLANLMKVEGGAENGVDVAVGDELLGDCKRDACAEAVVQCLENKECTDIAFSIISNEGKAYSTEQWKSEFIRMRQ